MRSMTPDHALALACTRHGLAAPLASAESAADRLVGLHATSPATPYLSLQARVYGFMREDLDQLLWREWAMARVRAMRLTMFVLPVDLLRPAMGATRPLRKSLAARWLRDSGLTAAEFDRHAAAILDALSSQPLTVRGLRRSLAVPRSVDLPGIVSRLCDSGALVGGAPPESWRSNVRQYHRWTDVLPDMALDDVDEQAALTELVRRYVSSYGPVTLDDIAWWTGLPKRDCHRSLETLDEVEEVTVDGWPGPLYCSSATADPGVLGGTVYALPLLDPYVQGYRDRRRFLDPDRFTQVYDRGGNSAATIVTGGRIIGVWQTSDEPEDSIRYHFFGAVPDSVRREAAQRLTEAGALYFGRAVEVVEHETMKPLPAGGGRSAAHPLDDRLHRASRRGPPRTSP